MGVEMIGSKIAAAACESRQRPAAKTRNRDRVIETAYRESAPKLLRFLRSLVWSRCDAEDLLHETYARFCAVENVMEIERPDSFLMTVAYNLATDYMRRRKNSPIDERYDIFAIERRDGSSSAEQGLIAKQELASILCTIEGLSQRRREVFTLRRLENLSFKEVSAQLGVSVSTAEKHMASAVAACTAHMAASTQLPVQTVECEEPEAEEEPMAKRPRVRATSRRTPANMGRFGSKREAVALASSL